MFRHLSVSQGLTLMVALLFGFLFEGSAQIDAQENAPIAFTILGPDGVVARVITTAAQCPEITIDGTTSAMQLRAAPDADFPVTVCDAAIAPDAKSASVDGQALKLPKAKPERIVVVGDTGCRLKGDRSQSCNDPAAWPLARIADNAAKANPDLVIHVGDYHYRESPCVVDKANCAGSPYGDNWASWNADLIAPARSLLQAAPWVMVRGNHEDCQRAGGGYFRLLDPRPLPASCPAYTDTYKKQFEQINAQAARAPTWLLLHDPMYVFGHAGEKDGKEQLFQDQPTLQQASNNAFPETVQAFISGHIHLFEVLSFEQGRPPQLVVGNGGTQLDPPITTLLQGLDIAGMQVAEGKMLDQFGFVVMDRSGAQWALGVKNASGGDMDKCILGGGKLLCGQTALPVGGGEMPNQIWLALALFGASIIVIGLALRARAAGHHTRAEQDAQ